MPKEIELISNLIRHLIRYGHHDWIECAMHEIRVYIGTNNIRRIVEMWKTHILPGEIFDRISICRTHLPNSLSQVTILFDFAKIKEEIEWKQNINVKTSNDNIKLSLITFIKCYYIYNFARFYIVKQLTKSLIYSMFKSVNGDTVHARNFAFSRRWLLIQKPKK